MTKGVCLLSGLHHRRHYQRARSYQSRETIPVQGVEARRGDMEKGGSAFLQQSIYIYLHYLYP